ncbi:MAG: hypothetical protein HUJ88_11095 [Fusobacterium necrophorum]|nr:hypothetical protein [Fusobacterium necrophorum]
MSRENQNERIQKLQEEYKKRLKKAKLEIKAEEEKKKRKRWRTFLNLFSLLEEEGISYWDLFKKEHQEILVGLLTEFPKETEEYQKKGKRILEPIRRQEEERKNVLRKKRLEKKEAEKQKIEKEEEREGKERRNS